MVRPGMCPFLRKLTICPDLVGCWVMGRGGGGEERARVREVKRCEEMKGVIFYFLSLVGAGNDPASKITNTLAITRVPAGNRF